MTYNSPSKISIVDSFKEYYEYPTEENLDVLIECMFDYDFENYEEDIKSAYSLYQSANGFPCGELICVDTKVKDFKQMKSNGSMGNNEFYSFGPNAKHCVVKIENFLRDRDTKTILVFSPYPENTNICRIDIERENNTHREDIGIKGEWFIKSHVKSLTNLIEEQYEIWGPSNILALPSVWITLSTNCQFRNWVESNEQKINFFVNSDWDFTWKTMRAKVRDQMVDWKTGFNFYTCEKGTYHFLPFFIKQGEDSINLLNLQKRAYRADDKFEMGSECKLCGCGRKYIDLKFSTHDSKKIKDNDGNNLDFRVLFEGLKCNYRNLQMHQNSKDEVAIYYSTADDSDEDADMFLEFFGANGIKAKIKKDKFFKVGTKRYFSWRSDEVEEKEFSRKKRGIML